MHDSSAYFLTLNIRETAERVVVGLGVDYEYLLLINHFFCPHNLVLAGLSSFNIQVTPVGEWELVQNGRANTHNYNIRRQLS